MSEREKEKPERSVEDLEVPADERDDLKGGALNTYISKVVGEKQGQIKGSVTQK
jgi:hypothetical protein